jgi:restriction system protein
MAKRRGSLVDLLLMLPWWVSWGVAVAAYVLLALVAPQYFSSNRYSAGIGVVAKSYAPFAAGFFLLIGCLSLIRALFIRRKFNDLAGIEHVRQLPWRQFESIVAEAFRRRGYLVLENAVDGPDGGIDLVVRKDGVKRYVQCKQWRQSRVGVKPIRELNGVIAASDAVGGFFVASGDYTNEARDFADSCSIELIDGPALVEMIALTREPEPYLDPTSRKRVEPTMALPAADPVCPLCRSPMVLRKATRGKNAGDTFWGCRSYPRCRGTRQA